MSLATAEDRTKISCVVVVVVLGFYVPPTAKVIRRQDLGLKSHPKDWRSPGSISRPLVYKASSLTTTPWRLLSCAVTAQLICTFVFAYAKSRFSNDRAHLMVPLSPGLQNVCMMIDISSGTTSFCGHGMK